MRGEPEVPEDKWLFEVALIDRLEHAGVRQVVETQAMQMSLNERQWRAFKDKSDVSWLYDGPHGDELGVMTMARMRAGCVLLLPEEEDAFCGRVWQQKIWRKFGKFNSFSEIYEETSQRPCSTVVHKMDAFLNFSSLALFRDFCVVIFNKYNYLLSLMHSATL